MNDRTTTRDQASADSAAFTAKSRESGEAFRSDLSAAIREEAKRFVEDLDRGFKTLCIIFIAGWASVMIGIIGLFIKG